MLAIPEKTLLKMSQLVTVYQHLEKPGRDGKFLPFTPVRAVGLALEEGWKASRDKGLSRVSAEDVKRVRVSGKLRIYSGQQWRASSSCTLQLAPEDCTLVLTLLHRQRELFSDLHINIWAVDQQGRCKNTFDLVGDFSTSGSFRVEGKLWIELKVFSEATFEEELDRCTAHLKTAFRGEAGKDPDLGGVMVVASKVGRCGRHSWAAPVLTATLLKLSASSWRCIVGEKKRKGRGMAKKPKPSLEEVWAEMEWVDARGGGKVGLLMQFLEAVNRPAHTPGKQARTYNKRLANAGFNGKIYQCELKTKCGQDPWVGAKATFRDLYSIV